MKHFKDQMLFLPVTPVKKTTFIIYVAFLFILVIPSSAEAQKHAGINQLLQEFFMSETVYAQEKNEIQITLKPAYRNQKDGTKIKSIPVQFEYGFTDRFQIELGLPYVFHHSTGEHATNGLGKMEVGFLYNVIKGNKPFAFSVAMGVAVPTVRKGREIKEAEETEVEWEPALIVAKQIGTVQIHASLVAEITKSESSLTYNLAAVLPMGNWRATLELNGKMKGDKIVYLTPGVIWTGLDDFEFGLGVSKSREAWGITLMAVYEFTFRRGIKVQRQ
jgi:hypothetical protein